MIIEQQLNDPLNEDLIINQKLKYKAIKFQNKYI